MIENTTDQYGGRPMNTPNLDLSNADVLMNWYATFAELREGRVSLQEWLAYWKGRSHGDQAPRPD